ncbi:hypothetical protein ABZ917_41740 [Nonomuraea wenchangensis]
MPAARAYTMTLGYANATGAAVTQGLACNGGAWTTVGQPPTAAWGSSALRARYNVIRLAKGSPRFADGTGYVELDYIRLI